MTLRLYLHKPQIILSAQLDLGGNDPVYPQNEIPFDNVTFGSYTNFLPGMTILFGTAPGRSDLGIARYIIMHPVYPTSVLISNTFSKGRRFGEVDLIDNTYITVLDEFRVWAKVPIMFGASIFKDGFYSGSGGSEGGVTNPPPTANGGTAIAGTVDGTGFYPVTLSGAKSFQFAVATGLYDAVTSYLWNIRDGTLVSGTLTTVNVTVKFPVGFRYIYLTVTNSAGRKHTHAIPVYVCDPTSPSDESITSFQVTSHSQTRTGSAVSIDFMEAVPRNVYPDGCLMMMWDDEAAPSLTDRSNIQFVGWHHQDEAFIRSEQTGTLHGTSMVFYDVCKTLETLPGFSIVVQYIPIPIGWSDTKYPNCLYYLWFLLYWHSTALEVADFLVDQTPELATTDYVILASDRANLYSQVNDLALVILPDHLFTCSRQGQMRIAIDPQVQPSADILYPDPVVPDNVWDTWTDNDFTEIRYNYSAAPKVNQVRTKAIKASRDRIIVSGNPTIEIFGCIAPGTSQGQGEQYIQNNERLVKTQDVLNDTEGNRYAWYNRPYSSLEITIPWEKFLQAIDVSIMKWVKLTISAENRTEREVSPSFTNTPGIITAIQINYQYEDTGLVRTVVATWEPQVRGTPAQTVTLDPEE